MVTMVTMSKCVRVLSSRELELNLQQTIGYGRRWGFSLEFITNPVSRLRTLDMVGGEELKRPDTDELG